MYHSHSGLTWSRSLHEVCMKKIVSSIVVTYMVIWKRLRDYCNLARYSFRVFTISLKIFFPEKYYVCCLSYTARNILKIERRKAKTQTQRVFNDLQRTRLPDRRMIWLLPPPPLPRPPLARQLNQRHTGRLRKRGNLLTGEGGMGVGE